jgi:hypothetical protein
MAGPWGRSGMGRDSRDEKLGSAAQPSGVAVHIGCLPVGI